MARRDLTIQPLIEDRAENIFIGLEYPLKRSDGIEGSFESTKTTIQAVKNNIRLLLSTNKGERLMQPQLGMGLQKYLFEQVTDETQIAIENDIIDTFEQYLPFVEVKDLKVQMLPDSVGSRNTMKITVLFNITKDPNSLESVTVTLGD